MKSTTRAVYLSPTVQKVRRAEAARRRFSGSRLSFRFQCGTPSPAFEDAADGVLAHRLVGVHSVVCAAKLSVATHGPEESGRGELHVLGEVDVAGLFVELPEVVLDEALVACVLLVHVTL